MINFSTEFANLPQLKRFIRECPERFTDAIETATNKAAARIRYLVRRETPNKWGVNKDEMRNFKLKRALRSKGELVAMAMIRGSNVPLFKFQNVTPKNPMIGKTTGGVSLMLAGQRHDYRHSFIAQMKNNDGSTHLGIFERYKIVKVMGKKGKDIKHSVIRELTTASVAGMTASEQTDIPNKIAPMIQEEFERAFLREAVSWLNLMGAK